MFQYGHLFSCFQKVFCTDMYLASVIIGYEMFYNPRAWLTLCRTMTSTQHIWDDRDHHVRVRPGHPASAQDVTEWWLLEQRISVHGCRMTCLWLAVRTPSCKYVKIYVCTCSIYHRYRNIYAVLAVGSSMSRPCWKGQDWPVSKNKYMRKLLFFG